MVCETMSILQRTRGTILTHRDAIRADTGVVIGFPRGCSHGEYQDMILTGTTAAIRGTIQAVEAAYFKLQEIANIANQRMPLVGLPQQRPMLNQRRHQNQQHQQHQQHQQQFVKGQSRPAPVNIHQDMPYDENDDYEYTPESPTYLPPEDPQDDHGGDTTTHKGN